MAPLFVNCEESTRLSDAIPGCKINHNLAFIIAKKCISGYLNRLIIKFGYYCHTSSPIFKYSPHQSSLAF